MCRVAVAIRPRDATRRRWSRAGNARRAGVGCASLSNLRSRPLAAAILTAICCSESRRTPRRRVFFSAVATIAMSASLLTCNNSRVIFSTARPLARANSYKVRVYSASPTPETARFTFSANGRARLVDLAGRSVKRAGLKRSRDGAITLELKPFEIVTFEVRAARRRSG